MASEHERPGPPLGRDSRRRLRGRHPYVYQEDEGGKRHTVASAYEPEDVSAGGACAFGFRLGECDRSRPLVIDPVVLAYSGAFPELLDFYNLLGDPGLKVR